MTLSLPRAVLDEMCRHAVEEFPNECCGMLVERAGSLEAVRVSNVQDQKHAEDPEAFPRSATTAYTMGPEAAPILVGHERGDLVLRAFYHSHPQHDAYFSAEDKKQATVWDEPSYPDAAQIVISVFDRSIKAIKAFGWNDAERDFVEVELTADLGDAQ